MDETSGKKPDPARSPGHKGRVRRTHAAGFGFLACDDLPGRDIYYKNAWLPPGEPPLNVGEEVEFEIVDYGADNIQARQLVRLGDRPAPMDRRNVPSWLFDWAYLGRLSDRLQQLQALALHERWEFRNSPPDPTRPLPILHSYLVRTFERLAYEEKVLVNAEQTYAAFNTGLVDNRYEPIHALFGPAAGGRTPWQLIGFCIAGEETDGQNLVRHFTPRPREAHYFTDARDLLYDVRAGEPELDWEHVILERISRYPTEFIEDNRPASFGVKKPEELVNEEDRYNYYRALSQAIRSDQHAYRRIMNRVRDAVDLSIKRVRWNFKTAIPTYYPRVRKLQLLLPLCLVTDEIVDFALAVEKTQSGSYLGHTVLTLDWAYKNARLVCRPDSDWLVPGNIDDSGLGDEIGAA